MSAPTQSPSRSTSPTTSTHSPSSNPIKTSCQQPSSYDLDNPADALSSYARIMHAHTLSQLDLLKRETRASTRRTAPSSAKEAVGVSAMGQLREESSVSSVDSVAS